jgi:imidazole glycerol-phosphate synthase subunit HisF
MFRPRIIPTLLLKDHGLVKTVRFKNPTYIGDPINAIKIFNELEADELIFLDITAAQENRSVSPDLVAKIGHEAFMPFSVGGGINTVEQVKALIRAGAEKVVINSASTLVPKLVSEAALQCGSQSIVVAIDVKRNLFGKPKVWINGGRQNTNLDPVTHARAMVNEGVGEIMINSIDRDGTLMGYDIELIQTVSSAVSIPVIASGGAGTNLHFKMAIQAGAHGVAAGSKFVFHGARRAVLVNYPDKSEMETIFV